MNREELLNQINTLLHHSSLPVEHLSEQAICAYHNKTLTRLHALFVADKGDSLLTSLEAFLKENWGFVRGTLLSYTALPDHDLTKLLIKIASYVVEEKNKKQTHTDGTISTGSLSLIGILMPGVSTDALDSHYPDLTHMQENHEEHTLTVDNLLRTYILSSTQDYLIPVELMGNQHSSFREKSLYNPYYNYQFHQDQDAFINEKDYQRLLSHSHLTRELVDALVRYETLCNDTSSLLGHLRLLCQHLRFNSSNGIGQETNAGRGVYAAIIAFNDYYTNLIKNSIIQESIPAEVHKEIELLLNLSSDPEQNINATANVATCIATRRTQLEEKIKIHESLLGSIMLEGTPKEALISEAKLHLQSCQNELSHQITAGTYTTGFEKSGLTLELLKKLAITVQINSNKDVDALMLLEPEELRSIFATQDMKQQWANFLNTIELEEFILFIHGVRPDRLETLLSLCAAKISDRFIRTTQDFSSLIITMNNERTQIIVVAMQQRLHEIIKNGNDFGNVLRFLSSEQRTLIIQAVQERLPEIIKDGNDFGNVLEFLSSEQRTLIIQAVHQRLPEIIKDVNDFGNVFEFLSLEQCTLIIQAMHQRLPEIIKDVNDFGNVLDFLSLEQCALIIQVMQPRIPEIIKDEDDFRKVLALLSLEQCALIIQVMQPRIPEIIKNGDDFRYILAPLSLEQCALIIQVMHQRFPEIIKDEDDFRKVLALLSLEHQILIFQAMQQKLPTLIQKWLNISDYLCTHFSPEQVIHLLSCCPIMIDITSEFMPQNNALWQIGRDGVNLASEKEVYDILYLQKLFYDLQQKSKKLDTEAINVVIELLDTLKQASNTYFISENKQDSYQPFKNTCTDAIDKAKLRLNNEVSWLELFEKIMLVIFSLGTVLLGSALNSRREIGTWRVRFFDGPMDSSMAKISDVVIKIPSNQTSI